MNIEEIFNKYKIDVERAIVELREYGDYKDGTIALIKLNYDSSEYDNVLDRLELNYNMTTGDYSRDGKWRLVGFLEKLSDKQVLKRFEGVGEDVKIINL